MAKKGAKLSSNLKRVTRIRKGKGETILITPRKKPKPKPDYKKILTDAAAKTTDPKLKESVKKTKKQILETKKVIAKIRKAKV